MPDDMFMAVRLSLIGPDAELAGLITKVYEGFLKVFSLIKTENRARRGYFESVHGSAQTPVFMNVGTCAAIRGGVSTDDLRELNCQIELSNTHRQRRIPGLFSCKAEADQRRGSIFFLAYRR